MQKFWIFLNFLKLRGSVENFAAN